MNRARSIIKVLLVLLLFLTAIILMAYPFIANYVFEHRTDSLVKTVENSIEKIDSEEKQDQYEKAKAYNEVLHNSSVQLQDPFIEEIQMEETEDYSELLNINQDDVMGIIEIPCIQVKLPIYHGTSGDVLKKGIGHLQGTSLPIGGESTHSVLTGHTGLSNAKLFTDLIELKEGNIFYLNILGEKLVYQVDQIKKVLPTELSELYVRDNKDYCTLVTCTPYGINTHRLLVRGIRIEKKETEEIREELKKKPIRSKWMQEYQHALGISISVFGITLLSVLLYGKRKGKYGRKE